MPSIKKINASLEHHTVVVQDLDNWLIYRDDNGQLVCWISKTSLNTYELCRLGAGSNEFMVVRRLKSYQEAIDLIVGGE